MRVLVPVVLAMTLALPAFAVGQPVVGFAPGSPLPDTAAGDLGNTDSQTKALSVAPTISGVTSVTSSAVSTVFPAATRNFLRLSNNNAATGSDLGCTDDGSTPTANHWNIRVFATTFYEAMRQGYVSNQGIQCIGITGTVAFVGEAF
jgi:hypothetical protein